LRNPRGLVVVLVVVFFAFGCVVVEADEIKGFTEPIRSVELASAEAGLIKELKVKAGETIAKGDTVAQLDDELQEVQMQLARHLSKSTSSLDAAAQTLGKREMIMQRIKNLKTNGSASHSEVVRSEMELAIAKSKYLASEEEITARKIELRRAEIQFNRRKIYAPFDGVVAKVYYDEGEYLTVIRPELLQLVQVDELLAVFPVPVDLVESLKNRKKLDVFVGQSGPVAGTIHSIGVTADASSGTINVKIKIDNGKGEFRSGDACYLRF
jgi:RND family efflux transporter MFP subunit